MGSVSHALPSNGHSQIVQDAGEIFIQKTDHSLPQSVPSEQQAEHVQKDKLDLLIKGWIKEISSQQEFSSWNDALYNRYPLGPGLHGWIVILHTTEQQELGYLVISATPDDKWILTEYGTGANPLFSLNTLYHSLMQQELIPESYSYELFLVALESELSAIRMYYSPLHAIWHIQLSSSGLHSESDTSYYLDAKTGEMLPLNDDSFSQWSVADAPSEALISLQNRPDSLKLARSFPVFDPFFNTSWLQGKALSISHFDQLQTALHENQLITYVAKLFNKRLLAPYAVTGYAIWNDTDEPFIRLEQDGPRYIPLHELIAYGFFFP